jgi:hypothetical protein
MIKEINPIEIETTERSIYGTVKGTIDIQVMAEHEVHTLTLTDVIYVSNIASNLLSTMTLYDKGYEIIIKYNHDVEIRKDDQLVSCTVREGPLFRLDMTTILLAAMWSDARVLNHITFQDSFQRGMLSQQDLSFHYLMMAI